MDQGESTILPGLEPRGRGAGSNAAGRFEPYGRVAVDDGWDIAHEGQVLRTEVAREEVRRIISRNASPDLPFDRSINSYRGCEHGCSYCFARPTHAYIGASPGLDFETRLVVKRGGAGALERELANPRYVCAPIAIGTNTDPYQPIEAREGLTRAILQVLAEHNHPVAITTKGSLIERDIDILAPMAAKGLVHVGISVTTLGSGLSRALEPRAPAPARRLRIIKTLAEAGIPVRVMLAPVIPGLTDHELEAILAACAKAGARAASYITLRLPREVAPLFAEWLDTHAPAKRDKVLSKLREMHGGAEYSARWHKRMTGEGPLADLIAQRFELATRRHGMRREIAPLRCDLFAVPPRAGDQLSLF